MDTAQVLEPGARAAGFELSDREFEFLSSLVTRHAGIALGEPKRQLVHGRLARRLRQLRFDSFAQYCDYVEQHLDAELGELINAITTNLTAFFREPHHFEHLAAHALPERLARGGDRRLRIWSAGCSSGEEAYSIAMTVAETLGAQLAHWDARILATDIDTEVLARAETGIYPQERIDGLEPSRRRRWFRRGTGRQRGQVRVESGLRRLITFRQLNLIDPHWPMRGPFDAIFCRNVVIYFDKSTQIRLFERYAGLLAPEGYLYIGHSESLHGTSARFRLVGRTIYQKRD